MMTDDRLDEIEARLNNRHRSSGDNDLFKEHAPTDLRDLLAEVRRLRGLVRGIVLPDGSIPANTRGGTNGK